MIKLLSLALIAFLVLAAAYGQTIQRPHKAVHKTIRKPVAKQVININAARLQKYSDSLTVFRRKTWSAQEAGKDSAVWARMYWALTKRYWDSVVVYHKRLDSAGVQAEWPESKTDTALKKGYKYKPR